MKPKEKDLLLKDLCARLPYGVKAQVLGWDEEKGEVEVPLKIYSINTDGYVYFETNDYDVNYLPVEECRLYLRPMSSMTEGEEEEYYNTFYSEDYGGLPSPSIPTVKTLDFMLRNHFDYRGLIPAGLALSTEEYNPYVED